MIQKNQRRKVSYRQEIINLKQASRYREGVKFITRYLKQHPATDQVRCDLAFFLYHQGKHRQSSRIYETVLRSHRESVTALQFLARVLAMRKNPDAVSFARVAYHLYPDLVMANNLANVYEMVGERALATMWYRKALKLARRTEDRLVVSANLALFYKRSGERKKGILLARRILKTSVFKRKRIYTSLIDTLKEEFDV